MNRKRVFRRTGTGRRILSFLFAFVWLFSASGIAAYAENTIIYSEPVAAPVRTIGTPQPEEAEVEPLGLPEAGENQAEPDADSADETAENETEQTEDKPVPKKTGNMPEENIGEDGITDEDGTADTDEPAAESGAKQPEGNPAEQPEIAAGNSDTEADGEVNEPEGNPEELPDAAAEDIKTEAEKTDEPERTWYAGTLTAEAEGCTVRLDYPAEAHIDEDARLSLETAKGAELYTALKSAAKVIRNEENETWKQQVAEDNNRFYVLKLTDPEGKDILPATGTSLAFEQSENPDGVTYFLTGSNARILEIRDGMLSVNDYRLEPFGYATVERIQTGVVTQEFQAADYVVAAAYGPEAGFPQDTEMKVREIRPDTPEYALYSGMTEETLGEEWSEITLERYFDITFVSGGKEVEPQADVDVQILFKDVIELTEEHDVQAVHIENNEAKVIESETESNEDAAKRSDEVIDTVSFTADSFSVYGVVRRTKITQKVLAADGNTYEISVTYGQDAAIPADAELVVTEIQPDDVRYAEYLQQAVRAALEQSDGEKPGEDEGVYIGEDQYGRFFDIEIRADGQEIEPDGNVSVKISLTDTPEERKDGLLVVHFAEAEPDILNADVDAENGIKFETDSFSVYGVITMPSSTPQNDLGDLDSRRFTMSHNNLYVTKTIDPGATNQFHKTRNANEATVWTFEATDTAGVYNIFTTDAQGNKLYMHLDRRDPTRAHAALSSTPQGFSVSRDNNGRYGIRTAYEQNGKIYWLNEFNGGTGFAGWHQRNTADDVFDLQFIDPVMENGKEYMVLVKYDGNYYIVNNDASLTRVDYDPVNNRVAVDNPMLWTVEGNNPNKHIYFRSEASGYTSDQLPSDYYRRYLDASQPSALNEENSSNVRRNMHSNQAWRDDEGVLNYPATIIRPTGPENSASVNYYNQQVYKGDWNGNNHLGVELNSNGVPVRLVGQQSAANGVEILFADPTEVGEPIARNHSVNHIDISIAGESRVNVPLAYGTYYYKDPDTGAWIEYNVTTNTSLNLSTKVSIDPEDMKHATIKAYDKNNNELDDAFVITGYSSNAHNDVSAVQVRVEGRFKVATVNTAYNWWEDTNSERMRRERLNNPITYVVSAVKNEDFNMVDPDRGQLYEKLADGTYRPLSLNMDVDMTASFTYYDTANECPPAHWNYNLWQSGGIIDGSGMDFVLGGDTEAASTSVVALEVTKQIVDENGMLVHPAEKIIHGVDIYGNTAKDANGLVADPNIVAEVNVNQYGTEFVPSGYTKFHSKNIAVGPNGMTVVYDYAIKPGMYYVTEDKDTIAPSFVDVSGDTWEYKETYIATEYVRRGNKYDDKEAYPDPKHLSKIYTMDDTLFAAVPEVVGTFKRLDNVEKKNGIVEFYIYNVYVNTSHTSLEVEKKWAEGTPIPADAEVTFELYYAKRQKTDHGELIGTPASWPDYDQYLPATGDPIFGPGINTVLTMNAHEAAPDWIVTFTGMPKTWRDSEGNEWELDYYARETAVTVNGTNINSQYIQTIVKEDAAPENADVLDGKVTITNAAAKTSTTVKKTWSDDAAHYNEDTLTLKLVRYRKEAPPVPEDGILNIAHITSGLPDSPHLPTGFMVTYSYSGPESASGIPAGNYAVTPGRYTVTATVTNGAAPFGYTYSFTSDPVTVNVPENGVATAEFTSFYSQNAGKLNISHISAGLPNSPQLPAGFAVTYSCTGNGSTYQLEPGDNTLPAGTYEVTANVTNSAPPSGYSYSYTTEPITVTVYSNGTNYAEFTSTYGRFVKVTAKHVQERGVSWNIMTDVYEKEFAVGTVIEIAYSIQGQGLASELYINGTKVTTFRGEGRHTYSYTILREGDILIEALDPWFPNGFTTKITVEAIGVSGDAAIPARNAAAARLNRSAAPADVLSRGSLLRASGVPEGYSRDDTWTETVTVSGAEGWAKTVEELDVFDEHGQPYYYAVLEENVPAGYDAEADAPAIATSIEDTELTVTNTYINPVTGNLIVSKTITGNAADLTKAFTFTVNATDAEGKPIPDGTYGAMEFVGGTATFTLTNGEIKKALELPEGTRFTVSEDPEGYAAERNGEDDIIEPGITKHVDYTNTRNTFADLKILKTVTGEEFNKDQAFTFTVTLSGYTGEEIFETVKTSGGNSQEGTLTFTDGKADIELKHNESLTIKNLPNGTVYTVEEDDYTPEYYEPEFENVSGTIEGGDNVTVEASFINPKKPVVDIAAEKDWGEAEYILEATAVRFALKRQAGNNEPEVVDTVTLTQADEWKTHWEDLDKYVDGNLPEDQRVVYTYSVEENGVYFGELVDGEVPEDAWVTDEETLAAMYLTTGGEVTLSGEHQNHGTATIKNESETTTVIVDKKWPDFADDDSFTWEATFRLMADDASTEEKTITIRKDTPEAERTFANLPKYRINENGEARLIDYTVKETAYSVYENGTLRYSYDGTNYVPDDRYQRYLSSYDSEFNEEGEEVITVTNVTTKVKSIRVTKEWMGIPIEETKDLPAASFALAYIPATGWGNPQPYEDDTGFDYTKIWLSYDNNWTWDCPVDLPEDYRYFVIETPLTKPNWDSADEHVRTDPLIDEFPIMIEGYKCRDVIDTGNWSSLVHFQQPRNANIGNHGEIKILNKLPGYMQMDLKKKFLEYRDNGNGGQSLYTTTGEDQSQSNMIIELQILRRTVDYSSGEDVYLTGWQNYGKTVKVGYDAAGNEYVDNPNPFAVSPRGSWNYNVEDNNIHHGLPTKGLYRKADNSITVVRYQYIYKEVQVYDGNLNPIGGQWTAWLPYAWDANGARIPVSELQTAQDQDRMLNAPGTSLEIEKGWADGRVAANVEEVYVRVERREYGSNGPYEDYLSIIDTEMELGSLAQNHFTTSGPEVYNRITNRIVLSRENDWKATIDKVQIFPNSNGHQQYEYRIVETGYMDRAGNVYVNTYVFEPVAYYKQGRNDADWVDQGDGLLLTRDGPNKLKVENTSHFGPLAIVKQVPEVSLEAAEEQSFEFHVELLLPPGMELKLMDLVVENGTISDFTCEGEIAEFTVTVQGTGMVLIDGIPFSTIYKVEETSVPEGWKQEGETVYSDEDQVIELNDDPVDSATITNIEVTSITAEKVWKKNGTTEDWPEEVTAITVGLYSSVNGGTPEPVTDGEGNPCSLSFGKDALTEDRTFSDLPVYDAEGNSIDYSIREMSVTGGQETAEVTDDTVTLNQKTWQVTADDPDQEDTATITNSRTEIHILKVDKKDGEPLTDAEFRLEKLNGTAWAIFRDEIATGTEGNEKGLATVGGLTDGRYTLTETKAPAGYIPLGMPVGFTVQDGAVIFEKTDYVTYDTQTATFRVQNKVGIAMPSTGGHGTLAWTGSGLALILLAGGLLLRRKRKNMI